MRTESPEDAVRAYPFWYHTIDLGSVNTPGAWDMSRAWAAIPWPEVQGLRCLDVGTFDGWFAFELERRGASEVVATDLVDPSDIDWPRDVRPGIGDSGWDDKFGGTEFRFGGGFQIARDALGSQVEWKAISVYDLNPDEMGMFDVVTCGSLLLHLRDPVRALEAIRSVCRGVFVSSETLDPVSSVVLSRRPHARLDGLGNKAQWWTPNTAGHLRMLRSAGFGIVDRSPRYVVAYNHKAAPKLSSFRNVLNAGCTAVLTRSVKRGVLHHAVVARPI